MKNFFLVLMVFLAISACQPAGTGNGEAEEGFSFQWSAIADELIERAALRPGERVLLVALPGEFDTLTPLLRERIRAAGAEDLGALSVGEEQPADWRTDFTTQVAGKSREALVDELADVDLGIMMPGAEPSDPPYGALQEILRGGSGRTIHFHWSGAYNMQQQPIPTDDYVDACYQQALLETDYDSLAAAQRAFESAMRGQTIRVTTPAGTDISFRIGDRPVTRQDGKASAARADSARNLIDREVELPAGAVRVAPIEESVQGTIVFPDAEWNGQMVEGLRMTIDDGRVSNFQSTTNSQAVMAVMQEAGTAARAFREFALGFNPLLAIRESPEGKSWIPYYGYGAGVVRLSLGDNTELGGNVGGGFVRWNFFPKATVTVGEEVWVKDGKMVME